jgi:hypothetical protein
MGAVDHQFGVFGCAFLQVDQFPGLVEQAGSQFPVNLGSDLGHFSSATDQ